MFFFTKHDFINTYTRMNHVEHWIDHSTIDEKNKNYLNNLSK